MQLRSRFANLFIFVLNLFFAIEANAFPDSACVTQAKFLETIFPLTAPQIEHTRPESAGITRRALVTTGRYEPELRSVELDSDENLKQMVFGPKEGKALRLGGIDYIEFPNSTALRVKTAEGKEREYLLTRGVRPYENIIRANGTQSPQNYVSDVLLFERASNGKFIYSKTLLKSAPEKGFLFEDPRVSVIYGAKGKAHFFLSGTDYSPHVPGSTNPDVMNRFVSLSVDQNGSIAAVKVDALTAKPNFYDMSPKPELKADGTYSFIDAKNGTIAQNEKGEIVVRLRLRPDFSNPGIRALAGGQSWHYGEQVYVFRNWKDFRHYNWDNSLSDLFHPHADLDKITRVRPRIAREILRDEDLKEMINDPRVDVSKGKGLGPGSIPIRMERVGNKLYISNGVGAPAEYAGTIPKINRANFILKTGEVKFLTLDHEIRYFKEGSFIKRHYTASFKLFNDELTHIEAYFADAIQPLTLRERGVTSGILDLQHIYPMGRTIVPGNAGRKAIVRIYSGSSDANTSQYDMDVMQVLQEMSLGSSQRLSGQVYVPSR